MFILTHRGLHIPSPPSGRGGTWVELTDKEPPRLFKTRNAAQLAAMHWTAGPLEVLCSADGEFAYNRRKPCDRPELTIEQVAVIPRRVLMDMHGPVATNNLLEEFGCK